MTIKNGIITDANEVVESIGRLTTRVSYQALEAGASGFTNRGIIGSDKFTQDLGVKSTVQTTSESRFSSYDSAYVGKINDQASGDSTHDPDSLTNIANAFDGNSSTYASKSYTNSTGATYYAGKTFGAKTIRSVFFKGYSDTNSGTTRTGTYSLETYNGSIWSVVASGSFTTGTTFSRYYSLNSSVQGVRIGIGWTSDDGNNDGEVRIYTLEYGDMNSTSSLIVNPSLGSYTPKSTISFIHSSTSANTSINYSVSDVGGSSYGVTGGTADTYLDTTSLTGSNLMVKYNLVTTTGSDTPRVYGYSIGITDY